MKLKDFISELSLEVFQLREEAGGEEISSVYCGDLLSDVMAHLKQNSGWFTIQGHINTIAVAQLKDAACIILVNGVQPEKQAVEKAKAQGVNILGSSETSADLCMKIAGKL